MRLFCWNVNSLVPTVRNINLKYGSLSAWFAHLDADIICMQEIKLPDSKLTKDLVIVEGYQSYWACSQSKTGYSGVTTWVRQGFAARSAEADPFSCEGCDKEGRAIVTDHGAFVLFNVYVPNAGDRPERARLAAKLSFLAALKERVDDLLGAGRQVILVGDLNIAAEKRDVHDAINWDTLYHPSELKALQDITGPEGSNCTDTWRHLHPDTEGVYTVWNERTSARAFNVGVRIDYALVSSGLLDKVQSSEVLLDLPPKWSDHAPLMLEVDIPAQYAPTAPSGATESATAQAVMAAPAARWSAAGSASATDAAMEAVQQQAGNGDKQQQQQLPPLPECPMWLQLLKRFQDPSQRSIAAMFKAAGKAKPAGKQQAAVQQTAAKVDKQAAALPAAAAAAGAEASGGSLETTTAVAGLQQESEPVAAPPFPQQQEQQQQQEEEGSKQQQQQQQQQGSQRQRQQHAQGQSKRVAVGRSSSGNSSSKQQTGTKRRGTKAVGPADEQAPKQAKLQAFFSRACTK